MKKLFISILLTLSLASTAHAALVKYGDTVQDRYGKVISSATVEVVATGTTTAATLYSDSAGSAVKSANGTTLTDTNGYYWFYIPEGRYDITVSKTNFTTQTTTDIYISGATVGTAFYTSSCASLNAAQTAAAAVTGGHVIVDKSGTTLTGNTTVTVPLTVQGGSINQSTYSLTINGPFSAPLAQVFTGTGAVTFGSGSVEEVKPEWFPNTQAGNQAAIDSVPSGGKIKFSTSRTVTSVTISNSMTINGPGGLTQAIADVGSDVLIIGASSVTVDGLVITGPVTTGNTDFSNVGGINFTGQSNITIKNCTITGKQDGIRLYGSPTAVDNIKILNNTIRFTGYGIIVWPTLYPSATTDYGTNVIIENNDVRLQAGYDNTSTNIRGVRLSHINSSIVRSNKVFGAQLSIEIWKQTGNDNNVDINFSNNIVDTWISMHGVDGGIIANNIIDYNLLPSTYAVYGASFYYGIEIVYSNYISVINNQILNQDGNGIYTGYAGDGPNNAAHSSHLLIDGNMLYGNAKGANANLAALQLGAISESIISNNKIINSGTASYGYAASMGGDVNTGTSVFSPIYDIKFLNNTITNTLNTTNTIRLFNAKGVVIDGLVSENNAADGIRMSEGFTYDLVIRNSRIRNNAKFAIYYNGGKLNNVLVENNNLSGNKLGVFSDDGSAEDTLLSLYAQIRFNKGAVCDGNIPQKGTFEIGDIWNISHATNKWLRCSAAGTYGTLPSTTMSTTDTSTEATVNARGALEITPGEYVTIAGVTGAKKILYIVPTFDSNGYSGATVYLSSAADATVADAAVAYSAPTCAQTT